MKQGFFIIFLFILLFLSCDLLDRSSQCERIIEKDKMIEILTDMYLLEAYIHNELDIKAFHKKRDTTPYFYATLFNKHDVSKDVFDKAFHCYASDRKEIDYINEEVINTISLMHSKESQKEVEQKQNEDQ